MNWLYLALALFAAAIALLALGIILRVAIGKAYFNSKFAGFWQAAWLAIFGTAAAWLFSLALT